MQLITANKRNHKIIKYLWKICSWLYKAALFILYFPIKGSVRVPVANSDQILNCGRFINVPFGSLLIGRPNSDELMTQGRYIPLLQSPHFYFARSVIDDHETEYEKVYEEFAAALCNAKNKKFSLDLTVPGCTNHFKQLITVIKDGGYSFKEKPVVVYPRLWRKDFIIMDGAHRASIIAAMGEEKLKCAVVIGIKKGHFNKLVL